MVDTWVTVCMRAWPPSNTCHGRQEELPPLPTTRIAPARFSCIAEHTLQHLRNGTVDFIGTGAGSQLNTGTARTPQMQW